MACHRRARAWVVATILAALLLPLAPAPVAAARYEDPAQAALQVPPSSPVELPELRTARSRTVRNPDGSFTASLYSSRVNYRDAQRQWQPISSRLVRAGSGWENEANSFKVRLDEVLGGSHLQFTAAAQTFSLGLRGAARSAAIAAGAKVTYKRALPDVDLDYDVLPDGIKETLILTGRRAPALYEFLLVAPPEAGVRAEALSGGSWAFHVPPMVGPAFILEAPSVAELAGPRELLPAPSSVASLSVSEVADGFSVRLTVDADWLRAPERTFPILIDPTLTIQPSLEDASFNFDNSCTRNNSNCPPYLSERLFIGTTNTGPWRAALKFDLGALPPGAPITDAKLGLFYDGWCIAASSPCGSNSHILDAHRLTANWSTSTRTNQLLWNTTALSSFTIPVSAAEQWMQWSITNTVKDWFSGALPNYGVIVKRRTEPLGISGPVPNGRRHANTARHPRIDVTYGGPGVILDGPKVLSSNGAELTWSRYSAPGTFDRYEIHRSATPGFTPGPSTLIATLRDAALTTYKDTTARAGATFTYEVTANGAPGNERTVTLPAAAQAVVTRQFTPNDKATFLLGLTFAHCWNYGADAGIFVGTGIDAWHRGLVQFDLRMIPVGSVVQNATFSMWEDDDTHPAATVNVHRVAKAWREGTGPECTGDGATWDDTGDGLQWSAEGGDYAAEVVTSLAKAANDAENWDNFNVTSAVQAWVNGTAPNHGLLFKLATETLQNDGSLHYLSDDYGLVPGQRPKLTINYTDGSLPTGPITSVAAPLGGSTVRGTAPFSAAASDDGRVDKVEFLVNGAVIATDTSAPFDINWSTTTNGPKTLTVRATDNAGNVTTSDAVTVTVDNTGSPTTSLTAPANGASVSGTTAVSASASDDTAVSRVEFFLNGTRFAESIASPYNAAWNTLDPALPAYDGTHELTSRATDSSGLVTASAPRTVTLANTAGTRYRVTIATPVSSGIPASVTYDPSAAVQEQQGITIDLTNTSGLVIPAAATSLYYRWYPADAPALDTAAPGASQSGVIDSAAIALSRDLAASGVQSTLQTTVLVDPPVLPAGIEQSRYRLQFDLRDTSANAWFAAKGNKPLENPVIVNKKLKTALGVERFYQYNAESLGTGMTSLVNVANGNAVVRWTPFTAPGRGLSTVLDLTYNSLERKSNSPVGNNWSLAISSLTRFGSPLDIHPNNADTIAGRSNKYIVFTDGDGTTHRFNANATDPTVYDEPPGVHLYLRVSPDTTKGQWAITRADRVTFYYDGDGFPTLVEDNNGNRISFTLVDTPPGEDPGGPKRRITEVVDAAGQGATPAANRKFVITYYTKDDSKKPQVRGKIKQIADHSGSVLAFTYYEDGNLMKLLQKGGTHANGTALPDRALVFTYTTPSGDGPAIPAAADRVDPEACCGRVNQSTSIYSMRDGRGAETLFAYYGPTSGALRWKLYQRTDRNSQTTSFAYDLVAQETSVTAPLARTTRYLYDTDGKVTRIVDPLARATLVEWSGDFHVTKVTEPGGGITRYGYNANGYITERTDQLANKTVLEYQDVAADAKDVSGKWKAGRAIPHVSQLLKKTDPKGVATITPTDDFQWSFEYDAKGNLTKVTDPERAVTQHAYNPDGTLASTTDANLKLTSFESYDANGLLTQVRDAKGQVTKLGHDDDGLLRWVQDPLHASYTGGDPATYRTYFEYDSFHRLGAQSTPKSTTNTPGVLVRTLVLYDENDNITRSHAPHYGALGSGARTTATYDAMDRRLEIVSPDTSSDPLGERTAFQYDGAGRLARLTQPLGVQSTATDQDFATFFSYDALDRVIREAAYEVAGTTVTQTRTTHFCFGAAGDLVSVTAPLARLDVVDCASTATPFTTRFTYDAAHRRTGTTDALGRTASATYDAHGNVETTTDAAGAIVRRAYDQRNQLIKVTEPLAIGRDIVTKREYDAVGNLKRVISPRAWDASADKVTFTSFVSSYLYDPVNQLVRADLPASTGFAQLYIHRGYDANGNTTFVSQPTTKLDPTTLVADEKTFNEYFDTGWLRTTKVPGATRTHYDYTAQGWQTHRVNENLQGIADFEKTAMLWHHAVDGMVTAQTDLASQATTFAYDANNQLKRAVDSSGLVDGKTGPIELELTYTGFGQAAKARQRPQNDPAQPNWTFSTFGYDENGNATRREENGEETDALMVVKTPRVAELFYDATDWLTRQTDDNATPADTTDDGRILTDFFPTGRERTRELQRVQAGVWTKTQVTAWDYALNGRLTALTTRNGADAVLEQHTVSYEDAGLYLNGNRTRDTFSILGPEAAAPCRTATCTATFTYDPLDRLVAHDDGHGGTFGYTLDAAGNVTREASPSGTRDFTYVGNQLQTLTAGGRTQKHHYDPEGNLSCVTTDTGTPSDCAVNTGGTVSPRLISDYSYDYLNRLRAFRSFTTDGTTSTPKDSATYVYDALDRPTEQTSTRGTSEPETTLLTYIGASARLGEEQQKNAAGAVLNTKAYSYDAYGHRLTLSHTAGAPGSTTDRFSYGYDPHGSVSLLLNASGAARAAYGYRPYGDKDAALTKGDADESAMLNPYRYTAKRLDPISGTLDMGARRFGPDTGRFLQRDRYMGALADLRLSLDPLTANRYSLAGGNPLSFVETSGHVFASDQEGGNCSYENGCLGAASNPNPMWWDTLVGGVKAEARGLAYGAANVGNDAAATARQGLYDLAGGWNRVEEDLNSDDPSRQASALLAIFGETTSAVTTVTGIGAIAKLAVAARAVRGLAGGLRIYAAEGAADVAPALSAGERVALNKGLGDAWRDAVAVQFDQMPNRMASTEVTKFTPFGRRVIDVEVSDANGKVLGGIETKFGNSPYTVMQQWKDMWLQYFQSYRVNVLRYPG
jgi:RHS repeat-associated protein